jgi:hypothetical protein
MAGRYQGRHVLYDADGGHREVEVFWDSAGWFWRPIQMNGDAVGPFTTSTAAYESAKGIQGTGCTWPSNYLRPRRRDISSS